MNANPDRLYELMPAIYRLRDAERGYPLKAFLRVITEQVIVVEDDIGQLYDNWFIETAQDWVVPYIGDLVGYRPVHEAGEPGDPATAQGAARNKILVPRREVANTIGFRRRKGTLALLEQLVNDVAGWPARTVEFYALLGWTQNINHAHHERGRTVDVRKGDVLALLDGPFDRLAHSVDVRRINSPFAPGRYNIPSVGVFVWRLKTYSVTRTPAYCFEGQGPYCYTFSVLGQDTPLYIKPQPEPAPTHIANELNLPAPVRRRAFERHMADYYGLHKSVAIWAEWGEHTLAHPIPRGVIVAADLSDWRTYQPQLNRIAVDPERGRLMFPPNQLPKRVRVAYRYAFSDDIGGGEYERTLLQPSGRLGCFKLYRVGEDYALKRINDALARWRQDQQRAQAWPEKTERQKQLKALRLAQLAQAVIEIADSGVYVEPLAIPLDNDQSLQIRAANGARPIIRLLDWQTDLPDSLAVSLSPGSRITLDGLLITGRAVQIRARERDTQGNPCAREMDPCASQVVIRHCTLVPGWGLHNDCAPRRPAEPSLELSNVRANVTIEHSIVGSIQIHEDAVHSDPIPIRISDSIVDAAGDARDAIGPQNMHVAHCTLTMQRCTVFGIVNVHAIDLAENSIFDDCLNVARRQIGCMRFCYVPPGCRTPRRYHCQPDLAQLVSIDALKQVMPSATEAQIEHAQSLARERVRPQFSSVRYGQPQYAQLARTCASEIKGGADDESEMGAFHDLFAPQREANLRARLDEYMPADMQAGIIFAS